MTTAAVLSQISFGAPGWLWALLLLPALAGLFLWAERQGERQLARLIAVPRLRAQLTTAASAGRRRGRFALLLGGLAGLVLAMAGPQWGYEMRETHRRGLDLVVIVDVSKSMLATDLVPDRLTRAKLSVHDLVGHLNGDRLGLVAFAGSAFLQAPLTIAYDAVLDADDELAPDLIPLGGTNLGAAIDLALDAFGKAEAGNRAIILLSDGEPTSDTEQADGMQAAARAAAAGVKIFTVGYGSPDGSLIPLDRNGQDFVRDQDGKIVRTRLNENGLRDLARVGGGFYTRFTSEDATMGAVASQGLGQLKAGEIDARMDRRSIERYQWPLGAGLVLLALAAFVGERRKTRVAASVRPARETAVAALFMAGMIWSGSACRAADSPGSSPPPSDRALELYRQGHYDEAYHAFEDMAKKNPDLGSLQFNAGASAYMGRQYDEALDAFGHALASDNPDLQAKSHYNFGNTLYRRGEEQKDRDAKIKDWKNALQHYDSTLDVLKRNNGKNNDALASNTAYNRDLVQKRLDEEMKQPPQQQQQQKQDQKDQKNQQKQDQQQQQQQNQDQKDQQKQDQQQQNQQNPSKGQQKSDQQNPQQQQQQNQDQQQQKQDGQNQQQNQPPQGQDQQQQQQSSSGKSSDQNRDANQPPTPPPSPSPSQFSGADQPRQHGDFQSQPGQSPTPQPGGSPTPADSQPAEPKEESGKMSEAQARALLDSLKGEDDRVMLNGPPDNRKKQDDPAIKDW